MLTKEEMAESAMADLVEDLRRDGGMLSRFELHHRMHDEAKLQEAAKQGLISITGDGAFASIFLIEN